MRNIDIKKLSNLIKSSYSIAWSIIDGVNYINNGYFVIKAANFPYEIKSALFARLLSAPEDGKNGIRCRDTEIAIDTQDYKKLFDKISEYVETTETKLFIDAGSCAKLYIFNNKFGYVHVQSKFVDIVGQRGYCKILGGNNMDPLAFQGDDWTMIALPVRVSSTDNHMQFLIQPKGDE